MSEKEADGQEKRHLMEMGEKREQRKMQKKCKAFAKSVLALKREKKKKREKGESLGIKEASLGISAMEAGGGGRLILRSFSVG